MRRLVQVVVAGSIAAASCPSPAGATPVIPVERPRVRHALVVLSSGGRALEGTLLDLSPSAVALLVDGQRRELPLSDVSRVELEGDSLGNGAVIGAVVLGGWCAVVCGQGVRGGDYLVAVGLNAGLGALIGVAIDAGHRGRTVLYEAHGRQPPGPAPRPSISFRVRF